MPKYKVLRPLDAGSESFAIGAIRELSRSDAAHLVRLNCLEEVVDTEAEAGQAGEGADGGEKQDSDLRNNAEDALDNKAEPTSLEASQAEAGTDAGEGGEKQEGEPLNKAEPVSPKNKKAGA